MTRTLLAVAATLLLAMQNISCDTLPSAAGLADATVAGLLAPAPRLPLGSYDYFGTLKSPAEARQMVSDAGLDPDQPSSYAHLGLVEITETLIEDGRQRFFEQTLGEPFAVGRIFNFASAFDRKGFEIVFDSFDQQEDPDGELSFLRDLFLTIAFRPKVATTNVQVLLSRELRLGSRRYPPGSIIDTGVDVPLGGLLPVGLEAGTVTCSLCHASVSKQTGQVIAGAPNTDLNISLFMALSPNTAAALLRLDKQEFDPLSPRWTRTGRRIIDSRGQTVQLPDPVEFEQAVDDFVLGVPPGSFEAAPDAASAATKIPDSFVLGEGGMGWDGGFQVGPFGGVAAFSNAVHSFELSLLGPAAFSELIAGMDPEVYLGMVLQNAGDAEVRLPDDVQPSKWLAETFPTAEREFTVPLPGTPAASLFSLNSTVFSPAGESFMYSINALSAFQQSLTVPPNRSLDNWIALQNGNVAAGARVFAAANCTQCHTPPYFTNTRIVANDALKVSPARGIVRRPLEGRLTAPIMPSFDEMVPLSGDPHLIELPAHPDSESNVALPPGLDTAAGGYKVAGLLGLYLKAPYLHDGGVAVGPDGIEVANDASWRVADAGQIGVPGTTLVATPVSAAHSLRGLLDRDLRALIVAANQTNANLANADIAGIGHEFFVDPAAGFTYQQQADLIAFLLALDDDPGRF